MPPTFPAQTKSNKHIVQDVNRIASKFQTDYIFSPSANFKSARWMGIADEMESVDYQHAWICINKLGIQ
jgi:hypothetical protein